MYYIHKRIDFKLNLVGLESVYQMLGRFSHSTSASCVKMSTHTILFTFHARYVTYYYDEYKEKDYNKYINIRFNLQSTWANICV